MEREAIEAKHPLEGSRSVVAKLWNLPSEEPDFFSSDLSTAIEGIRCLRNRSNTERPPAQLSERVARQASETLDDRAAQSLDPAKARWDRRVL
jgi:hypothetical protein